MTRRVLSAGTATVNGSTFHAKSPAWTGLRLAEATARTKSPWTGLPDPHLDVPWEHPEDAAAGVNSETVYRVRPMIEVGDRRWVKEVVACGACAPARPSEWAPSFWRREQGTPANPNGLWYAADGLAPERTITSRGPWVSPIFCPRWASRLTLIVESVRVERLQDISEEDAVAEGVSPVAGRLPCKKPYGIYELAGFADGKTRFSDNACDLFRDLWNSIHGPCAWDANPWVAVIGFRAIHANIDATDTPANADGGGRA